MAEATLLSDPYAPSVPGAGRLPTSGAAPFSKILQAPMGAPPEALPSQPGIPG